MTRQITALVLIIAWFLCSSSSLPDITLADKQVDAFHQSLAAGLYEELYEASSDDPKKSITKKDFSRYSEQLIANLEK